MQDGDGWKKVTFKNRWPALKPGTPICLEFHHTHNRFFKATPYHGLLHSCKEVDLTFNRKLTLQGVVLSVFDHQHQDTIIAKREDVAAESYYSIAEILVTDIETNNTFTVYLNAKAMTDCTILIPINALP